MKTETQTLLAGLDIETTGIDQSEGHRIIEIAIGIYRLEDQKQLGSFVRRINPQRPIDPAAQEVHGISFDMLADCPLWEDVAPHVSALLCKCNYVVAHNGEGFDLPFVYAELLRAGQRLPSVGVIDTMLQARWATADGSVPNLGALCFASGVPYDPSKAHGALYDVEVMMASFFSQYQAGFFKLPTSPYVFKAPVSRKKGAKK